MSKKILVIDINCIPKGWDAKDFLKNIREDGIAWIDKDKPGTEVSGMPVYICEVSDIDGTGLLTKEQIDNLKVKRYKDIDEQN